MKIKLVSLEDGITSCGFRKIASFISQLYKLFNDGQDVTRLQNFWFRQKGQVVRNGFRPLMTTGDMEIPVTVVEGDS